MKHSKTRSLFYGNRVLDGEGLSRRSKTDNGGLQSVEGRKGSRTSGRIDLLPGIKTSYTNVKQGSRDGIVLSRGTLLNGYGLSRVVTLNKKVVLGIQSSCLQQNKNGRRETPI